LNWVILTKPIIDSSVRSLCRNPYPGHRNGCPNWNRRPTCPPQAKLLPDILDLSKPVYCIYNVFDLSAHLAKMHAKHPNWTDRQIRCCLYWQSKARKELREKLKLFLSEHPEFIVLTTPEACGVDVDATMASLGAKLEWPPVSLAYQVALVGSPHKQA
jgi:hypothetical protein